ncbi:hypothetical protein C0081_13665 [Cohaesibacter celericrescens]|uniref:Serine kinase n=1 Tax=Cohaesibacter celericrescens TaxID=2067669 RepID=A0A2N5XQ31_9HYPH|nr:hypothetical protein C0081_13665 [Cohaesibacter celericrescens]
MPQTRAVDLSKGFEMTSRPAPFKLTIDSAADYARQLWSCIDNLDTDSWFEEYFCVVGRCLKLRSPSRFYLDLCLENLVLEPFNESAKAEATEVIILDRRSVPSLLSARWDTEVFSTKAFVEAMEQEKLRGIYDPDHDLWQFYDHEAKRGLYILRSEGSVPPWEASFPLRNFIHWSCQETSQGLLHAGTAGVDGDGVLIVGPGGSGKSGTTLAAILSGMDSVGDDYVLASLQGESVEVRPVIAKMKQDAKGLARLGLNPDEALFEGPNWQNKYSFDFAALGRGMRAPHLKIKAALLPRISHGDKTSFTKTSGMQAMLKLSPSNLYQLTGDWQRTMQFSGSICRNLPAFHMDLGAETDEIADSLRDLIKGQLQ